MNVCSCVCLCMWESSVPVKEWWKWREKSAAEGELQSIPDCPLGNPSCADCWRWDGGAILSQFPPKWEGLSVHVTLDVLRQNLYHLNSIKQWRIVFGNLTYSLQFYWAVWSGSVCSRTWVDTGCHHECHQSLYQRTKLRGPRCNKRVHPEMSHLVTPPQKIKFESKAKKCSFITLPKRKIQ